MVHPIDNRRHQDRYDEFIDIVHQTHRQEQSKRPNEVIALLIYARADIKGDKEDNEAVDELRDQCRPGGSQPNAFLPRDFFDLMKYEYIDQLTKDESGQGADDNKTSLP